MKKAGRQPDNEVAPAFSIPDIRYMLRGERRRTVLTGRVLDISIHRTDKAVIFLNENRTESYSLTLGPVPCL